MTTGAAGVSASCAEISLGGMPGYPLAARPYPGLNVTASALPAALADETAGAPDGPAVPSDCRTPASSADEAIAGQPCRADPGRVPPGAPGGPDTPSRVRTAGSWARV